MSDRTILIVDDDSTNRMIVRKLIEKHGISVLEASDGHFGVEMFIENDVSAVIMDTDMPIMSGPKAAAEIQNNKEKTSTPPLVVLSGRDVSFSKEAFKDVNVSHIFQKPFNHKSFVNVILNLL